MKFLIFFGVLLISSCSSLRVNESRNLEANDYYVLMSNLLRVNEDRFSYVDAKGIKQIDELKKFKQLEQLYIKYIEPDLDNKKFSQKQLKTVMFLSYYAQQHQVSALLEYLAADLMPVYMGNSKKFLQILNELPFLVPANCNRLNAYFGFEGKNAVLKSGFIKTSQKLWGHTLDSHVESVCLRQLK